MAHCRKEDLNDLGLLLESIRKINGIKEKSFGCFSIKSKGVLHFHKTKEGRRFAHLWTGQSWIEIDMVDSPSRKAQMATLKQLESNLPL